MSESYSEISLDSDPEPEPIRHWRYVQKALHLSRQIDSGYRYGEWLTDSGESQIILQPKRIRGQLAGMAFRRYAELSVTDKHQLENASLQVMNRLDTSSGERDMRVLINYVPLLFAHADNAVVGQRKRDGDVITFESDKIHSSERRDALLGGLATIFYYTDFPHDLEYVE